MKKLLLVSFLQFFFGASNAATGNENFFAAPPSNDDPCNAITLTAAATCNYSTYTNDQATATTGAPAPACGSYNGGDVWFRVTVPAGGGLTFNTQAAGIIDGAMAVYSGTCNALTEIGCGDDNLGLMPSVTAYGLTPGSTIWVRFWAYGGAATGTFDICVIIPPPPPSNDEPCNAVNLTVNSTCTYSTYTNTSATPSAGVPVPSCGFYNNAADVWFKVTVPAGGALFINTEAGAMLNGDIAIYTGTCNALTEVACNADGTSNAPMGSLTAGGLTPGSTLWIRVWDYGGYTPGTFGICVTLPPPPPANDNPCTATALTVSSTCIFSTHTNISATGTVGLPDPGCGLYAGQDVWFTATVPLGGGLFLNAEPGTMLDGAMAVYTGTSCNNLTLIRCDDNSSATNVNMPSMYLSGLTPGSTVWIRFWGYGNYYEGTFGICVSVPPPPTVQDCPAAIPICQNIYNTSVSYVGTGNLPNEISNGISCLGSGEKNDVWYTFTVQASGNLNFTITPNNFSEDYDWAVYNLTNATCRDIYTNAAIDVSCNFSGTGGYTGPTGGTTLTSQPASGTPFNDVIPVVAGETYVINVSNFSESNNGYTIDFTASTASIFDNVRPVFQSIGAQSTCGGNELVVNFSENILCSTVQNADFTVTGPGGPYTVTGWASASCSSGATYGNNITLTLSPAITTNGAFQVCLTNVAGSVTDLCGNVALPGCFNFNIATTIPTFAPIGPVCTGSAAPVLPGTSTNGITGTWNPATLSNTVSGTYTFTPSAGQCAVPVSITVTVTSGIVPLFNTFAPVCTGSVAPVLPTTSTNGITGTWLPAIVSNTVSGTYTFTPAPGQCAITTTLDVTVSSAILPIFTAVAPICTGSVAPVLPTTSTNGITGTWSPAIVSNIVSGTYTFIPAPGQCAVTTTLDVTVSSAILPVFTAVSPICAGSVAPVLPTTSTNGITGTWSPVTVDNTTSGTYTFTPDAGQCATTRTLNVTVTSSILPLFPTVNPICTGSTAPVLPTTSTNGITGTWSPATVDNTTSGTYTFTPDAGQCATTTTLNVTVISSILPTFPTVNPICTGSTAPVLPTTSTNGITGTWSPATVDNTTSGTYTFTPAAGQCATTTTLTVTITPNTTPTFIAVPSICSGAAAPVLPTTSTNGITGTWSPATVDNTTSGTYTFTPDAGQCATTTTLDITVSSSILATFPAVNPICTGSVAPVLPTTSTNGITGTWSPATVDNTTSGTYTFTPDAGQCATTTTLDVTVTSSILPTFPAVNPICTGSVAPVLPTTSTNGITGTWSPAVVDNTASGTYTFTPAAGQCATTTTLPVTVNPAIIPAFNSVTPICSGSAAPVLPTTSTNGITGTWSPATVSNTTTGIYTFTPSTGQCATTTTLDVTVSSSILPTFPAVNPICTGSTAPVLPTTSTNGITGTWSPVTVDNTTSGTYTFTPDAGQCATTTTLDVTVSSSILPTFPAVNPICTGSVAPVLPTTSANGIIGTWSPATVDNTTSGTYTFTPDAGQCATTTTLDVTVSSSILPTFPAVNPICTGSTAPVLPTTSTNGITGTWSPATVDNTTSGTYTFTPDAGQCASTTTLDVTVSSSILPTFPAVNPICTGSVAPVLPTTSTNGITGTWSPATVDNTTSGTYTFTSDAGQCATTTTLDVTVSSSILPTFPTVNPICTGSVAPVLPTTSTNGITGTWSPATVDNTTSGTYTFTPDAGQCATTTTLDVTVSSSILPTFPTINSICTGSTAPVLPTTSTNGITGTWSPATVDNTTSGTYTFTPDAGQCATTTTLDVTVSSSILPTFPAVNPICTGSVAPVLPTTSTNGITGTWSPATVDNTTSGTYTFTPDAGQCATTTTLDVTVSSSIVPTFNPVNPICTGSTAPVLPTTSTNGITGTWSPATVDNTTSGTYTFTPDAGQCATTTTLDVTVSSSIIPTFNPVNPICIGSTAPVLPTTSTNGITGTWSPATVSNTASGTYTFTPNAGQCATGITLPVTVNPVIIPLFNSIPAICSGSTAPVLPTTSTNGITGTWSPATVNNTTTTTYTFTPSAGPCTTTAVLTVPVNPNVLPTFNAVAAICSGSTAPVLPTTSTNGITGTWSPATVSNTSSGTYTFTPSAGQCALQTTLPVTVNPLVTPLFGQIADICSGSAAPVLPATSTNGISGTWSPATVSNTSSGTYTFTPSAGQCGTVITLSVTVNPTPAAPLTAPVIYCQHDITSALGATITTPGSQLLWYTSATGGVGSATAPVPSSDAAGNITYYVSQVEGPCEGIRVPLTVTVNAKPDLGPDHPLQICFGQFANIAALYNTAGYTSNWTLNQSTVANPDAVTVAGLYQLIVQSNSGCADTALVNLGIQPPVIANAGPDDNAVYNSPYQLSGSGGVEYQWSPSTFLNNPFIPNPQAVLTNDQTFILMVKDDIGCMAFDTVKLRVLRGPTFYVPTAFSPNGDGLNDIFRPTAVGIQSMEYFRVFNRYGELIYETSDLSKGWDGTYKGKKQNGGNYVWTIKGTDLHNTAKTMRGNVVLIR